MKAIKILKLSSLLIFIIIATQSCMVSSLYPLYDNTNLVHIDKLNGKWLDDDNNIYEITTVVDSINTANLSKEELFMRGLKSQPKKTNIKKKVSKNTANLSKEELFMRGISSETKKSNIKSKDIENEKIKKKIIQLEKRYNAEFTLSVNREYYIIKIITEKDTSIFTGRLAKLGDHYFLDIIPNEDNMEDKLGDDYMISLVIPMHGFFKVEFIEDKLKLNWIYSEDLKELRNNKKIRLEHISRDDREIITAKTTDIQKFLIKFADSKLFNNHKDAELILSPLK